MYGGENSWDESNRETATLYAARLKHIPFSRALFLSGSVARGSSSSNSDIDIVVVSAERYVWLHRVLLFVALTLLGIRRTRRARAGRICINASVGESRLPHLLARRQALIPLWKRAYAGRSPAEFLLHYSAFACLGNHISRYFSTAYVRWRMRSKLHHPDTVIRLTTDWIEYYPPRS